MLQRLQNTRGSQFTLGHMRRTATSTVPESLLHLQLCRPSVVLTVPQIAPKALSAVLSILRSQGLHQEK